MKLKSLPHFASAIAFSTLLTATALSQVMSPPGTFQQGHRRHGDSAEGPTYPVQPQPQPPTQPQPLQGNPSAAPASAAGAPAAAAPPPAPVALPPSLLDQPAQPAKVDLSAGKLTIHADNSSLSAILEQVSNSAGMTIDGLNKDERIFGTYGPGDPHEILSALLDGTGYNVLMFGETTTGTPRQLTLSPRGAAVAGAVSPVRTVQQNQEEEEDDTPPPPQAEETAPPPSPQPGPPTPGGPNGIRTPQQMLQELQQLRQQQQQQQQQPQ